MAGALESRPRTRVHETLGIKICPRRWQLEVSDQKEDNSLTFPLDILRAFREAIIKAGKGRGGVLQTLTFPKLCASVLAGAYMHIGAREAVR